MLENINTAPNSRDDGAGTPENYLSRAVAACEAGDARLGLHLYLAAFEQAAEQSDAPSEDAIMGLKQAWRVACSTKERALAEYIFERLEPYLSDDEVQACVEQLQVLAMERLEGIGLSGDDLMEMTEALSGDFMEMVGPMMAAAVHGEDAAMAQAEALAAPSGAAPAGEEASQPVDIFSYDSISGYGAAVARMRSLGVGLAGTPEFDDFVAMLNSRHGLDAMPVVDSLLFCSPAREDASRFMLATVGELGLPAIRMRMEETFQGVPMLCVSAQATDAEKLASLRHGFAGPGILVLEDLDLWGAPVIDAADDMAGFFMAAMSRGAREAVNLIRQAVENPDVYVLASASSLEAIDPFFAELLFPLTCVDIDYPTAEERAATYMFLDWMSQPIGEPRRAGAPFGEPAALRHLHGGPRGHRGSLQAGPCGAPLHSGVPREPLRQARRLPAARFRRVRRARAPRRLRLLRLLGRFERLGGIAEGAQVNEKERSLRPRSFCLRQSAARGGRMAAH